MSYPDDNDIEPNSDGANDDIDPALKELWDSAPPVDGDRIWQQLDAALDHTPRSPRRIAWRPLGRSITAIAATLLATAILVPAVLLTSGGTAQANFLDDVDRIDRLAGTSLADSTLSSDETNRLAERLAELLQDIQDDPDLLIGLDPSDVDAAVATLSALRLRLAGLDQGLDLQTTLASIESATSSTPAAVTNLGNDDDDADDDANDDNPDGDGNDDGDVDDDDDDNSVDTDDIDSSGPGDGARTESFVDVTGNGQPFVVLAAGTVFLQVVNGQLQLLDITTIAPWTQRTDDSTDREIEIDFFLDDARIRFNAELQDDGETIRIRIEDRTDNDADDGTDNSGPSDDDPDDSDRTEPVLTTDTNFSAGAAGNVTLRIENDIIVLVEVFPADVDWTFESTSDDGDLEVEFSRGDERIRFQADLQDDGAEIRIRLSSETDDSKESSDDSVSE